MKTKTLILHTAGKISGYWNTALWVNDQCIEGYAGVVDIPDHFVGEDGLLLPGFALRRQASHGPVDLISHDSDGNDEQVEVVIIPRQITSEEQRSMSVPKLPDAFWLRECYRLGLNPLPTCRQKFPEWQWEYNQGTGEGMGFYLYPDGKMAVFPAFEVGTGGGKVFATRR